MKGRTAAFFLTLLSLTAACNGDKAFCKYADTAIEGWEKNDTLTFDVKPLAVAGNYQLILGLRTGNTYPFKSVTMIAEQTVFPSKKSFADTIECKLYDDNGKMLGNGISSHQYLFNVANRRYNKGDSIHIAIRHDMKRETLTGIGCVGIELTRQN